MRWPPCQMVDATARLLVGEGEHHRVIALVCKLMHSRRMMEEASAPELAILKGEEAERERMLPGENACGYSPAQAQHQGEKARRESVSVSSPRLSSSNWTLSSEETGC